MAHTNIAAFCPFWAVAFDYECRHKRATERQRQMATGMNAYASAILLGVKDMEASKRFYTEGLGWKIEHDYKVSVFFVQHGGTLIGFYGRDGLAANAGVPSDGNGFHGVCLNYVVRSEARVRDIMELAKKAGATITKPAGKEKWGGYGGAFMDPDGFVWQIAFSAQGENHPYAE